VILEGSSQTFAIHRWPNDERPRERLQSVGPNALSNRELLAILIGSGTEGQSALDVGAALLRMFGGSLRQMGAADLAELMAVHGIGPAVAARLIAALELGRRLAREEPAERTRLNGPRDVYERCGPALRDLKQEEFRLLLLNTQNAVLRELVVTRGTLDTSVVHPREVFRPAIAACASTVLLVHNHPSGDPTPSPEDREITAQLAAAGQLIGIPVLDHIVIGDSSYVSFVERGWLKKPESY
jgi:DNA repair protein RadC